MKSILLLIAVASICVSIYAQEPCCAPSQWQAGFEEYLAGGTLLQNYIMLDMINNQLFLAEFIDPDSQFQLWWFPSQGVQYSLNINSGDCMMSNDTFNITNFCPGYNNETFETTVTIGSAIADIWMLRTSTEKVEYAVDDSLCVPISMEDDAEPNIGKDKYRALSIWYDAVGNLDQGFPPLAAACQNPKVNHLREAHIQSKVISRFFKKF